MNQDKLSFHVLIRPYVRSYASIVAAYLGWRLLKKDEFTSLLQTQEGLDTVGLASEVLKQDQQQITFSFRQSVAPLIAGDSDHFEVLALTAQQLVGHCYEILHVAKLVPIYGSAIIEFFRHIRNGCFHGNRLHFVRGEPRNYAQWRNLSITPSLQNQKIFRDSLKDKSYMLNFGDPLLLLHDVTKELK